MDISIIIPAYNEEQLIVSTVQSIQRWMPDRLEYEVIVVDHGSSDKTATLASSAGATIIDGAGLKTIAALRNNGVKHSSGQTLIFLDADTTLTPEWSANISKVIQSLGDNSFQICGSLPKMPEDSAFIIKSWFEPKATECAPNYIGSCHLITSRILFDQLHGFPEHMETSEDFNFCLGAVRAGATIVSYPELMVIHNGAPKTLLNFIRSEVWHGRGDWTNLASVISSKVALMTLVFLILHGLLLSALFVLQDRPIFFLTVVLAIVALCFISSFIKFFKYGITYVVLNTVTFYFYFFGRSISLFSAVLSKGYKKRMRVN